MSEAKSRRGYEQRTDEEIELAIAWFNGTVTNVQVTKAMGGTGGPTSLSYRLSTSIKREIAAGRLKIERIA